MNGGVLLQLANEFLYEQTNRRQMVPQSFEMAGLLQELREMDEAAVYKQSAPQRGELCTLSLTITVSHVLSV